MFVAAPLRSLPHRRAKPVQNIIENSPPVWSADRIAAWHWHAPDASDLHARCCFMGARDEYVSDDLGDRITPGTRLWPIRRPETQPCYPLERDARRQLFLVYAIDSCAVRAWTIRVAAKQPH